MWVGLAVSDRYTHPVIFNHTQVYTTSLQRTIDILPNKILTNFCSSWFGQVNKPLFNYYAQLQNIWMQKTPKLFVTGDTK